MTESGMFVTEHPRFLGIMLAMDKFICPGAKPGKRPRDWSGGKAPYFFGEKYWCQSPLIMNAVLRSDVFAPIDTLYQRLTQDDLILSNAQGHLHDDKFLQDKYYPRMLAFFHALEHDMHKIHVNQYERYAEVYQKRYTWQNNTVKILEPSLHISTWAAIVTEVMLSKFNPVDAQYAEFIACC